MRKFLARSIGGADELAGYALAIGTAWGLGAALLDRAHIRIDSLYVLFPQKLRLALDLVGARPVRRLLRAGRLARPAASCRNPGRRARAASPRCETPTVIPQALWIVGLAVFVVVGVLLLVQALAAAAPAICAARRSSISTRSAEEEVEDEIRDLKERQTREGSD